MKPTIMRKPAVLIVDEVHPMVVPGLEALGYECIPCQARSKDEIGAIIPNATGIIIRHRFKLDAEFLSEATDLHWIGRSGVGLDAVDLECCRNKGIEVLNAAGGNAAAVGEHVIGMILSLLNHLNRADEQVRQGHWNREANRGKELGSLTVGIIGHGHTGRALAQRLSGFGCNMIAYDKYDEVSGPYAKKSSLEGIYREADIVTFHVPSTEETYHYFDTRFLEQMRNPFYLINVSRGPVTDISAIVKGLRTNKILGVGLDVLENEPKDEGVLSVDNDDLSYLLDSDKVIFS
ncbi:MAG: phosphoglycerate dehydrogenase, partial [Flavobacteriales bacterium]|nr:phosphoglycerate dehydrogenase [Flavobacteriales bacterium]